jgi:ribosomal protein S18 acetylase RimI-like enzyme
MDIVLNTPPPLPKWPDGINVRTLIPGQDERNVLEVQRTAFRDHWGYMDQPFEAHFERWWFTWQNEGEFDPSLWFLAMDGEIIAGISLCKLNPAGDQDTGWVSTLGVRREYRRKGLGMALLLHSFQVFYQLGKARVGLGVDASSLTGATRLYQKAGMSVVMQIDIYEKELRPGRDLATRD